MQLLGTYNSNLASFQYQELLALLQAAISDGDLSSGSAFDKTNLLQLEAQATSFGNLPLATAGTRALDESLNQPLSLLSARFIALLSEANNFVTRSTALLAFLEAETDLLDQLLAADGLRNWIASLPELPNVWSSSWDFSTGQGKTSILIPPVDPSNQVNYPAELTFGSVLDVTTGLITSGVLPPAATTILPVKNLKWTFSSTSLVDELYGPDMSWAELTLVESLPQVDFTAQPSITVILPLGNVPTNFLSISGQVPGGALPTYLRLLFYPRTNSISGLVTNTIPFTVSPYTIDPDNIQVYTTDENGIITGFFDAGTDYTVDQTGSITPITIGTTIPVTVRFSENFPAYQCSVDQQTWSDIHMLDLARPYRDDETNFTPLGIKGNLFPLTDETGLPTGLYFSLTATLKTDYTLLISTPGASSYGPRSTLEIDMEQPKYCTALSIKPFNALPATLVSVELEGLTSATRTTAFAGSILVDKALDIRFPRQLITAVYLTFVQENYTITEYQDLSTDSLRRSTMATVEASLPFSLGQYIPPVITTNRGFQYELGFEDIVGKDVLVNLPGILVQGPMNVSGCPLIVRLDMESTGTTAVYLCYEAFNSVGVVVDSNTTGFALTPGDSMVLPYTSGTDLSTIASVQLSLKFALRDATSVISRYNLQATLR